MALALDLLRLTRPFNVVLFLAATALGGVLVAGGAAFEGEALGRLLLAMLSATLVGAGSMVVNDLYDVEIDQINRPDRPLASGRVSRRAAWMFYAAISITGWVLGAMVSPVHGVIAALSVLFLWAYSTHLKGTVLLGNVAVGATIALGVLFGGLAAGPATGPLWAGVILGGGIVFVREIAKDVEDVEGDRAGGARTLPIVWGERRALGLALGLTGALLASLPLAAQVVGSAFYVWGLGLAACLLVAIWTGAPGLISGTEWRQPARRMRAWLKGALVAGIAGLVLTRLA
ncbi:MAG: geranylgeranylglycerol-phosphate geranylgeranyltransferase [Bacteroidota bacterium]